MENIVTLEEPDKIERGQIVAARPELSPAERNRENFLRVRTVGRPKGARAKLAATFLKDMNAAWEDHGAEVIQRCIKECPKAFLTTVASLMPKEFTGENGGPIEVNNGALDALMRKLGALAEKDLEYEAQLELKARESTPKALPQPTKLGRDS